MRAGVIASVVVALAATAHAEPDNSTLFYVGLAMAPPTYVAGVSLHEGSHALAAKLVGADVEELHLFPPGIDPHTNTFRFGWTYVSGLQTRGDRVFFYIAPKITDAVLLGGFAALILTDTWPHNRYGQLALTVGATGLWVDFSKDVVLFSPTNDVSHVFSLWCMTGWKQVPARLVYAGIAGGFAYAVVRGYQKTFTEPTATAAMVLPVFSSAF
jgi:hypothetical protein